MAFVRGLEHSSWTGHHRTSCVRPVDGQGQGGATGRQRDRIRKKKKLRLEEGQCVGKGFIGQFSINKLKNNYQKPSYKGILSLFVSKVVSPLPPSVSYAAAASKTNYEEIGYPGKIYHHNQGQG